MTLQENTGRNLSLRNYLVTKEGRAVRYSLTERRRKKTGQPRRKKIQFRIGSKMHEAINVEAERRRIPVGHLLGAIVEVMIEDNLFVAVLGD